MNAISRLFSFLFAPNRLRINGLPFFCLLFAFCFQCASLRAQSLSEIRIGFLSGEVKAENGARFSVFGGDLLTGVFQNDSFSLSFGNVSTTQYIFTGNEDSAPQKAFSTQLHPNFPNPFNPATTLRFELAQPSRVTIRVYDMLGRLVATPVESQKPAGVHLVPFNAGRLASGMYLYTFDVNGVRIKSRQFSLVK